MDAEHILTNPMTFFFSLVFFSFWGTVGNTITRQSVAPSENCMCPVSVFCVFLQIDYPDVQALKGGHPHRNINSANLDRLLAPDLESQHDLRGGMRRMNSDSGIEQVRMVM